MTARAGRVLIVEDEASVTDALSLILGGQGYVVETADSVAAAEEALRRSPQLPDLVFVDLRLPGGSGIDLLERIKAEGPDTEVILMTAHGSLDLAIEAIKKGAFYYLEKPFTPDQVLTLAARAGQLVAVRRENALLRRTLVGENEFLGIVGRHAKMQRVYEVIRAAAPSSASVLIEGESGTGKELVASALHLHSPRAEKPFIRINCAAIPRDLLESELFGYRRGAFTGADRDKRGLIEAAAGGTLLLDEVTEMPLHLQPKMLRVLQERRVRRLGDEQETAVDFRLVSATNQDTAAAIKEGLLRQDLYFRLSTVRVRLPPLREHLDDLPLLAERFLARYGEMNNKAVRAIAPDAYSLLYRYDWPGNIRELESAIEHAVLFCRGATVRPEDLPEHIQGAQSAQAPFFIPPGATLEEIENEAIRLTLERTGGNIKRASEILNVHRPTLYRKLRKMGLITSAADRPDSETQPGDDESESAP